jgi:hypothetical protein
VESGHGVDYPTVMTDAEVERLLHRLFRGEQPTDELTALRENAVEDGVATGRAEMLSDLWSVVLHRNLLPALDTAKALVELAVASETSYPISISDGLIYDALRPAEREELVQFIRQRLAQANTLKTERVLIDFADDLLRAGPQV